MSLIPEDLPAPNTKRRRGRPRLAPPPPKPESKFGEIQGFDFAHFREYLNALKISTKEEGFIVLGQHLMGTQVRWLAEIEEGLSRGIHEFVTLKCRQIGISSVHLALDLYFPSRNPGLSGALILHEDAARTKFRSTLETYYEGLPEEWQKGIVAHNVNQLVLENGSTLEYKVAGVKQTSAKTLGRSSALVFGHMTEPAFWGDGSQIAALKATFAEHNQLRFYSWESTANGFNHFQRLWQEAKSSSTMKAIFVTWWSNEYYRCKLGSALFERYWGKRGKATPEERDWAREVQDLYGHEIDAEQFA